MIESTKRKTRNTIMIILWLMLVLTLGTSAIYSHQSIRSDVYISLTQKQRSSYVDFSKAKQGQEATQSQEESNVSAVYPASTVIFAYDEPSDGEKTDDTAASSEEDADSNAGLDAADFMKSTGESLYSSGDGMSEAKREEVARHILAEGQWQGHYEQYQYRLSHRRGVIQVTFLNYASIRTKEYKRDLLLLIIGILGMIASFFIARKLAAHLLVPVEENFRMQKQFISDASHELRTPLAVINANVDRIVGGSDDPKHTKYIKSEVRKMSRLTEEMLELARIDDESRQVVKKQMNLSEITLRETLPYEAMAFEADVELRIDVDPNLMFVGDEDQITRLVGIMVDNASKHVTQGGKIGVRLKPSGNRLILSVVNTGAPIPKEERERIFERFYQVDKSRSSSRRSGFGLGLSIAKAIVEAHGGRIYVGSDHDLTGIFAELPWSNQKGSGAGRK